METTTVLSGSAMWKAMEKAYDSGNREWIETTQGQYEDMLNILPPRLWDGMCFLMGEEYDTTPQGVPIYSCFNKIGGRYYARFMTIAEFRSL